MTDLAQTPAPERLALTPDYGTPYNAIIRDDVVMGVSRYFLERWLPVLGPSVAALVNTLRQLDYRCQDDAITISGAALAREAAMSRRHLYTCLDHPWIGAFVQQETGPRRRTAAGTIRQEANRYRVRMDDPLTPADADHLLGVLTRAADTPLEAARRAREMAPRDLWAPDPTHPADAFTQPKALSALDVLERAFPAYTPATDDDRAALVQAAEDLHRHLTLVRSDGRAAKIIVPQYFRRRWWPHLGHDLAWAYLWLRGSVYDNPDEGVRRDICWIPALSPLLAALGRPREWWRRNVEHAAEQPGGWQVNDFFRQIDSQKGRDPAHPQWVARQFTVALDVPVAPEDRARYDELVDRWPVQGDETGSATFENTGENKVRHIQTHRPPDTLTHPDTLVEVGSGTTMHIGLEGVRHIPTQGSGTSAHSQDSESLDQASSNTMPELTTSQHPATTPAPPSDTARHAAAAADPDRDRVGEKGSLPERLAATLARDPACPLFRAAPPEIWLQQAWPEPVRRHSPAWRAATEGQVSPRDLVALMLAVWADPTITYPPRYLSWLFQRWQTLPDAPPVERWEAWQALADLPLGQWLDAGRRSWLELVPAVRRALPFGLEDLAEAQDDPQPEPLPDLPPLRRPVGPVETPEAARLREPVGSTGLSMREIWRVTLDQIRMRLDTLTYDTWVEGARPVRYEGDELTIQARSTLVRDWLVRHLAHDLEATVSAVAKQPVTLRFEAVRPQYFTAVLPGRWGKGLQ